MQLSTRMALRFLSLGRSGPADASGSLRGLKFFSWVAMLSIAATVALFLMVDSILQGFSSHLEKSLTGFEAPLFIHSSHSEADVEKSFTQFTSQKKYDDLQLMPVRQFDGLLSAPGENAIGVRVRILPANKIALSAKGLKIFWREGFDQNDLEAGQVVLVGRHLYERLRFVPGSEERVSIVHPFADLSPAGDLLPAKAEVIVGGFFVSGLFEFDDLYVLAAKKFATQLGDPGLMPLEYYVAAPVKSDVRKIAQNWNRQPAHESLQMTSWLDRNDNRVKAARLERIIFFLLFLALLAIASLNLAVLVALLGFYKTPEAAVLKAIGASTAFLRSVFVRAGLMLGIIGTLLGVVLGLLAILVLRQIDVPVPEAYAFTRLPMEIRPGILLVLLVLGPLVSFAVSLYPASRLAKLSVTEGMKQT